MALRVVTAGTTRVRKITRGPGSGTTIVKRVTVGVPQQIGQPSTGAIANLDDVNGRVGQVEGTYLRFDSASGIYLHRPFDSDAMAVGLTSVSWNADSGKLTLVTGTGDSDDPYSKSFTQTILTPEQLETLNSATGGAGLIWEKSGKEDEFRTAIEYVDSDAERYGIRSAGFENDENGRPQFRLSLSFFSPSVTATGQNLFWDESATSFSVLADNPDDFLTRYIDSVASIVPLTGSVGNLITSFDDSAKTFTPAGGVDWQQTFNVVDSDSRIQSTTSDLVGGSASATVFFTAYPDSSSFFDSATFTTNWQTASSSIEMSDLTGNTFLQSYSNTAYTVTKTGVKTPANHLATVTPTGGTVSDANASGIFTFTTGLHKDNNSGRSLSMSVDFVRADGISSVGTYTSADVSTDTALTANFTYPSFWLFTVSTGTAPVLSDIVSGTSYAGVNTLGNQQRSLGATITNSAASPQGFWFGVRSAASQPTSFSTGSGPGLLVEVTPVTANVALEPDPLPAGYNSEVFNLYGITLQPGDTYVSIS